MTTVVLDDEMFETPDVFVSDAIPPEERWKARGLCNYRDPEAFYDTDTTVQKVAARVCLGCPVLQQCREWAFTHEEIYGVWGGTTERERRKALRRKPVRSLSATR